MIEAYSLQKAKVVLVDDRENLEQFENYGSILNRMYMDAVEGKHNMKETVRTLHCNTMYYKLFLYKTCLPQLLLLYLRYFFSLFPLWQYLKPDVYGCGGRKA